MDGPEFDGHKVDFDLMMRRLGAYKSLEAAAHEKCHLEMAAEALTEKQAASDGKGGAR